MNDFDLPANRLHVLIVEDNPGDAVLIKHLMEELPIGPVRTTWASSVEEAFEFLSNETFSLIFADLDLPDSAGLETVARMLENPQNLPVVVLSGADSRQVALEAIRMGAQDFLEKGLITANALERLLSYSLERHSIHAALQDSVEHLEAANRQFVQMISDLSDAVIVVDLNGAILFVNPAAELLFGKDGRSLVGSEFGLPIESAEPVEVDLVDRAGVDRTAEIRVVSTEWEGRAARIASLRDITERKRAERAMRIAQQAAETASEMKSRFLANMSHELRTPLNSIIGFSELLKSEHFGDTTGERYRDYASDIHYSGQHLLALINDLLDLSRAESGRYEIVDNRFDLVDAVRSAIRLVAPQADAKSQKLELNLAYNECEVIAGERQITQIVVNLLGNAVKFTPDGGRIEVRVRPASLGGVAIDVEDTGIGIEPSEIPRLFTAYTQVGEPYVKPAEQGTGLGLALSKRLIELHGGFARMQSTPGEGTAVTVVLPRERLCADDVEARIASD